MSFRDKKDRDVAVARAVEPEPGSGKRIGKFPKLPTFQDDND